VGIQVANMMIPRWLNWHPPRVMGTAWAFAYSSRRRRRTASGVGVVCESNGVKGSCGRVENVVVTAVVVVSSPGRLKVILVEHHLVR
jgi:hypothetical protein